MIQGQTENEQQNHQQYLERSQQQNERSSLLFQSIQQKNSNQINQKIEAMKHSINQMSILSTGKPLQNLNRIQSELELHRDQMQSNHKKSLNELNSLQKHLLSIQKQRFMKQVAIQNQKDMMAQQLSDFQEYIHKYNQKVTHKISDFRDRITDLKVEMVEIDTRCKEKSQKVKQKYIQSLMNSEKNIGDLNKNSKNGLKDKMRLRFKELHASIQQENRKALRQKRKYKQGIQQLRVSINRKIDEQQYRQKEGFQHNYDALEEVFSLLASQINQK